jgi:LysR family transcriptional regulator, low CO2-responsive transcriptional regulator
MINLNQLRVFQAVARTRSFTRAADVVHLTQPGISKHIKQMEEYYGLPLFDRLGKKVALTQAGEILFDAAQEMMLSLDIAEQRIEDLKGLRGGRLVLGASFPIAVYILPAVLAAFRKEHPAVEVKLDISLSERTTAKVVANKVDLGLVSHEPNDSRLLATVFMTDELVAIAPSHHHWAAKNQVEPRDLLGETFIAAPRGAGTRAVVEGRLKEKGVTLQNVLDFGNPEGVKHAVEAGLGVSIQARSVVQQEISAGALVAVPLARMDVKIEYLFVCRRDKHLSAAAKAFLALLHEPARTQASQGSQS